MISFRARVRPLSAATEHLLKSDTFGFLYCTTLQRALFTNSYLLSNCYYKEQSSILNVKKYHNSSNIPKNFGKIVELEDFNKFEVQDERINKKKKKNKNGVKEFTSPEIEDENLKGEAIKKDSVKEKPEDVDERTSYKAMDKNSALLCSIMTKLKSKKRKDKNKKILLEGKRLIYEAIVAGLVPEKIFFCRSTDVEDLNLPQCTETYRIPYKSCELWADVITPQGVIGVFKMPNENSVKIKPNCLPLTVICDNVRDPGNLGSIIRVAAGAGCEKLVLTSGCTGVWEPKVLRASAGAHFHFPILKNCAWTDMENLISENSKVFVADGQNEFECDSLEIRRNSYFTNTSTISKDLPLISCYSAEFENKNIVIIIGGETHGVSDEAFEFALKRNGSRIFIPMNNAIESLNNSVAFAVLAFEFKRKLYSLVQEESQEIVANNSASDS